jgi:hypothetical protein
VLTLTVGVLCIYVFMFVLNLAAAGFVVDSDVLSSSNGVSHPVDVGDYLGLAWLTTSAAIVGSVLGSTCRPRSMCAASRTGSGIGRDRSRAAARVPALSLR